MERRRKTHAKKKHVWTTGIVTTRVCVVCVCVYIHTYIHTHIHTWSFMICGHYSKRWVRNQKGLYQYTSYSERLRRYGCCVFVVNALMWTARRKWHYAIFNQLGQERTLEAATRNSRALHTRAAEWVVAGGDIFANLLKAQVSVNWRQFHEIKLNSYFNCIRYYSLSVILFYLFSIILTLYSKFQATIAPQLYKIRPIFIRTFLITRT